jgi:hypothetical protein
MQPAAAAARITHRAAGGIMDVAQQDLNAKTA